MKDFWTDKDGVCMSKMSDNMKQLKKKYVDNYGKLPDWNSIQDVWRAKKELEIQI